MNRIDRVRRKVKNRISYYNIIARKRGIKLCYRHRTRLEHTILAPYDLSLNEMFQYRYGGSIIQEMMQTQNQLLKMISKGPSFTGGLMNIPPSKLI